MCRSDDRGRRFSFGGENMTLRVGRETLRNILAEMDKRAGNG